MRERFVHWCTMRKTHRMCGLPAAAISVLSAVISSLLTWKQMVANQSQRRSEIGCLALQRTALAAGAAAIQLSCTP